MSEPDHLFSTELDALIAHHNRPPVNWVIHEFPYDQKPAIVAWLRGHGLDDLAAVVDGCDRQFIGMCVAGYRESAKRERQFWDAFLSVAEAKS